MNKKRKRDLEMETEKKLIDSLISVYFNDGERITRKDGIAKGITDKGLFINEDHGKKQLIPLSRVVRIELKDKQQVG